MNKLTLLFLSAFTAFSLSSCGGGEKTDDNDSVDSTGVEEPKTGPVSETFFQVPSPGEMLTFIKMVGGKTNKDVSFLNPPSNEKNYTDAKLKALNFGIYSCDLSYCSIFEIGSESLKYFKTVKVMGDQIGVSTAIKPEVLKRLESNIGSPDSLAVITDDVYFSSFEALEDSRQGPTLALVVAGGWLESIYIAVNLAKYKADSPVIERLADQKYTLENLIEFLKKHEADPNVMSVKGDFEGLLAEFNKIGEQDAKPLKGHSDNAATLGGGKQLVISEAVYNDIIGKIKSIRNSYTLTK
ncbi:hypothetical protein [Aurantibacillus circumpalustris]|uniref:hypothetical protein n=1 Tax=Aurantibacillus circumpalustris TaxID=3036359 RepID=UPI00295AF89F|nr:hypothetical protein [Aurantibacillus circumpalustris]